MKLKHPQIDSTQRSSPRHVIIKPSKIKHREIILNAVREKKTHQIQGNPKEKGYHQIPQQKPCSPIYNSIKNDKRNQGSETPIH